MNGEIEKNETQIGSDIIKQTVEALRKGTKEDEGYWGPRNLEVWARGVKARVGDELEKNPDKTKGEIVDELIEAGTIKTKLGLHELHSGHNPFFSPMHVVSTLREFGVVPENSPDKLEWGRENGHLIELLENDGNVIKTEGKLQTVESSYDTYKFRDIEYKKPSKFPGVDVAVVVSSDMIPDYKSYSGPNPYPWVQSIRLDLSNEVVKEIVTA